LQKNTGETHVSFEGKLAEKSYLLQFNYISQNMLNTMGISYCGAHLAMILVARIYLQQFAILIDWNIETEGAFTQSRAEFQNSKADDCNNMLHFRIRI